MSLTPGEGAGEGRDFVRCVAAWQWGSIGLTSGAEGLWSRKRHRQEVRAGQSSLEMLYHRCQQLTVSHQGREKLLGIESLRVCVCSGAGVQGQVYVNACMRDKYYIIVRGVSARMPTMFDSTRHMRKTSGRHSAIVSVLPGTARFRWSHQRGVNVNWCRERRAEESRGGLDKTEEG